MSDVLARVDRGIFVLDHHGFGNVIMSLPLLQAVSKWAAGRCTVTVLFRSPEHFRLLQNEGLSIKPVYLCSRYQGVSGLYNLLKDFRGSAEMLISVPGVPLRTAMTVKVILGAKYLVGEALPLRRRLFSVSAEKGWTKSVLQTQKEIASLLRIEMPSEFPVLHLSEMERDYGWMKVRNAFGKSLYPIVGVQCSAKTSTKQWPPRFFGEVLSMLRTKFPQLGVISFGNADERDHTAVAREVVGETPWLDGVGQWNIRESLAMLRVCDIFISGDTGVMHMAAGLGVRTVSVFGPTSPERLAPFHSGGVCAKPATSCHPCFRDKWTSCACISLVQPSEVAALAENCLLSQNSSRLRSVERCFAPSNRV